MANEKWNTQTGKVNERERETRKRNCKEMVAFIYLFAFNVSSCLNLKIKLFCELVTGFTTVLGLPVSKIPSLAR